MFDLPELLWEQTGNEVIIKLPLENGTVIYFPLNEKLINYICSNIPRFVYVFIDLAGENKDRNYFINFEKLKTTSSADNSLKIRIGKPIARKSSTEGLEKKGQYCIARSESFQDRFLTESGWHHIKTYYDIFDKKDFISSSQPAKKPEPKLQEPEIKLPEIKQAPEQEFIPEVKAELKQAANISSGKRKNCIQCGESIPSNADVCMYCNASQYEQVQVEDDTIDISI